MDKDWKLEKLNKMIKHDNDWAESISRDYEHDIWKDLIRHAGHAGQKQQPFPDHATRNPNGLCRDHISKAYGWYNQVDPKIYNDVKRRRLSAVDILKEQKAKREKEMTTISGEIDEINQYLDDLTRFIFHSDSVVDKIDQMVEWIFDNNFVYKIEKIVILKNSYKSIKFKNESDAIAFKLKWSEELDT